MTTMTQVKKPSARGGTPGSTNRTTKISVAQPRRGKQIPATTSVPNDTAITRSRRAKWRANFIESREDMLRRDIESIENWQRLLDGQKRSFMEHQNYRRSRGDEQFNRVCLTCDAIREQHDLKTHCPFCGTELTRVKLGISKKQEAALKRFATDLLDKSRKAKVQARKVADPKQHPLITAFSKLIDEFPEAFEGLKKSVKEGAI